MVTAYVFVVVEPDSTSKMDLAKIEGLEGVKEALKVYGAYDLVVKIDSNEFENLQKVIKKLRTFEGVEKTTTMISMD